MHFTTLEAFTLLSTDMYIPELATEGTRIIQLMSGDTVMAEKSVFLNKGKNEVGLDFQIPIGSFTLRCDRSDQFQNIGALDFPFPIGDVGQLDSSSTGLNFYPYFFNWKIQKEEKICVSNRTPVFIEVTGLNAVFSNTGIRIFPIPASKTLQILFDEMPETNPEIMIRDFSGRLLNSRLIQQSHPMTVDVSGLPSGMYHMMVALNGKVATRLFVVDN
jgi:hypothetical protein